MKIVKNNKAGNEICEITKGEVANLQTVRKGPIEINGIGLKIGNKSGNQLCRYWGKNIPGRENYKCQSTEDRVPSAQRAMNQKKGV